MPRRTGSNTWSCPSPGPRRPNGSLTNSSAGSDAARLRGRDRRTHQRPETPPQSWTGAATTALPGWNAGRLGHHRPQSAGRSPSDGGLTSQASPTGGGDSRETVNHGVGIRGPGVLHRNLVYSCSLGYCPPFVVIISRHALVPTPPRGPIQDPANRLSRRQHEPPEERRISAHSAAPTVPRRFERRQTVRWRLGRGHFFWQGLVPADAGRV